jgi:hypothetical protein
MPAAGSYHGNLARGRRDSVPDLTNYATVATKLIGAC